MRGSLLLLAWLPISFAVTTTKTVTVTSTHTEVSSSSTISPASTSTSTSTVTDTNVASSSSSGAVKKTTSTLTTTETLVASSSSPTPSVKTVTTDVTTTVASSTSRSQNQVSDSTLSNSVDLTTILLTTTLTEVSTVQQSSVDSQSTTPLTDSATTPTGSTATSSASASSTTEASPQFTDAAIFKQTILDQTNSYRNSQSAPALAWNDTLQTYAQLFAGDCTFTTSNGPYGETLSQNQRNVDSVLSNWMNERADYNFNDPEASKGNTADFTQMVWLATQSIGCARQNCNNANDFGGWFVVCEYYPKGNIPGQYKQNVLQAGEVVSTISTSASSTPTNVHGSSSSSTASSATASSTSFPKNCENGDCSKGHGIRVRIWTTAVLLVSAMASTLL